MISMRYNIVALSLASMVAAKEAFASQASRFSTLERSRDPFIY